MWSLIALYLESAKFRCSFTLVIKCWEDIPMYVKFVSLQRVLQSSTSDNSLLCSSITYFCKISFFTELFQNVVTTSRTSLSTISRLKTGALFVCSKTFFKIFPCLHHLPHRSHNLHRQCKQHHHSYKASFTARCKPCAWHCW